jgi:hypothetical protein
VILASDAATGLFDDNNVGTGKPVTASGFTIFGEDAGNYALLQPVGLIASITVPADLDPSNFQHNFVLPAAGSSGNVNVTILPSSGGARNLANIEPAAGGNDADSLANIEPAAGGDSTSCWSDAADKARKGHVVHLNYNTGMEAVVASAGCQ